MWPWPRIDGGNGWVKLIIWDLFTTMNCILSWTVWWEFRWELWWEFDANLGGNLVGMDLELLLDSLWIEVALDRSWEWLPLRHIHLLHSFRHKHKRWDCTITYTLIGAKKGGLSHKHPGVQTCRQVGTIRAYIYLRLTSPSPASITSLMPLFGKSVEAMEWRNVRVIGVHDQGKERHSSLNKQQSRRENHSYLNKQKSYFKSVFYKEVR